jgi:glycosyltransferase involved in cell wall biosynthesis
MSQRMKILFMTPRYLPHIGGVEKHLSEVTRILSRDHQVTIVTDQYDSKLPVFEQNQQQQIYRIPIEKNTSQKVSIWWWLVQHLNLFFTADVIHVHDVFYWILPFRFLFFWKRFYITFHGYEAPGPLTTWQIRWHKIAAWLTRGNICVGDFHKDVYGVQPTFVTYGGVNPAEKSKPKRKHSSFEVLFVGRIAEDTGVKTYFSALKKLPHTFKYSASFYGEGSLRAGFLREVGKDHLTISFPGSVVDPSNLYEPSAIVFASQYLGILQALNYNKNVIAVADSALKKKYLKLTPFTDWISIVENELEILQVITKIKNKKLFLPKQAHAWAQQQTWKNVAEKYIQLWQK